MKLGELKPAKGSTSKAWRRGRGHGSGNGKTSGRGHKGQRSRAGSGGKVGFEGGQMPLYRRLPKRGFTCRNTKEIVAINIQLLNVFNDGDTVDIAALKQKGLVSNPRDGVKILGNGSIDKKLTVKVNQFSQGAADKIKSVGGSIGVI